jgi:copper transport protein
VKSSRFSLIVLPLLALVGAGLLAVSPQTADAHALLSRSDPAANAQLKGPPTDVTAFFTESVDTNLSSLQVVDTDGNRLDDGNLQFGPDPAEMRIGIKGTLGPGYYTVLWQTLSSVDGHLFKGFYTFTVLNADGTQPAGRAYQGGSTGGTTAAPDTVSVRWGRILGITAVLGSLVFFLIIVLPALSEVDETWRKRWRDAARKRALIVSGVAVAGLAVVALGELYVQSHQLGGLSYVDDVLKNDWGTRWIQRQITLGGIAVALGAAYFLARRGDPFFSVAMAVAAIGGLVYVLLVALVSHGDTIPGSFWAVGADFLHIIAASVWIGMLLQLLLFLLWMRRDVPDAQKRQLQAGHLSRFGTIAATSVIVLLATGAANAVAQLSDWSSLYDTAYGRALLLKLGIMCLLLLAAAVNAFYLRPRIVEQADEGKPTDDLQRRMTLAVRVELALGIAVLFAAAVLVLYPTSRQTRDAEAFEKASTSAVVGYEVVQPAPNGDLAVDFTVTPGTSGFNSFRVFLFPTGGGDIGDVLKVRMKINFHTEDLGQQIAEFDPVGEGVFSYKTSGAFLTRPGQWDIDVTVQRRGVDDETVTVPVTVSTAGAGQGQFKYPLTVGSWLSVAMAVMMVLALLAAIWISEWPGLPEISPRFLRVGTATLTVLGAGILALSLIPGESKGTGNPIPASAASIARGHDVYVQNCSSCHGINGDGKGPSAAGLTVKPADFRLHIPYHQDTFFFNVITNGLGTIMPSWSATISEEDRWNIINYLHSAFGSAGEPAASGSPTPTPAATP